MEGSGASPAYCTSVLRKSHIVLLKLLVLTPCGAQEREEVYRLDTADYRIEMRVRFYKPYLSERLVLYSSQNPGKELCYRQRRFILLCRTIRRSGGCGYVSVSTASEKPAGAGGVSRSSEGAVAIRRTR